MVFEKVDNVTNFFIGLLLLIFNREFVLLAIKQQKLFLNELTIKEMESLQWLSRIITVLVGCIFLISSL